MATDPVEAGPHSAQSEVHSIAEYKTFIGEIFRRLDAISESLAELKANPAHPDNWKNCEFCWTQIRKICEYLTVALVFAHHCETGATDLEKWKPKDLLAEVLKLSGHPTPIPIEESFDGAANAQRNTVPLARPIAPKLISEIYGRCSELIHVGSLQRILDEKLPAFDIGQLETWLRGFRNLLANHVLLLPNINKVIVWVGGTHGQLIVLSSDEGGAVFDTSELPEFEF